MQGEILLSFLIPDIPNCAVCDMSREVPNVDVESSTKKDEASDHVRVAGHENGAAAITEQQQGRHLCVIFPSDRCVGAISHLNCLLRPG